jgi:hypothetical protein
MRVTVRLPRAKKAKRPCADAGKASTLEATYFLDFDQGEVESLAKRLVGSEKDSGKAAEILRMWTFANLKKLPVNNGMASASVAIAAREGDAVEHAVVLAALCRAVGIPARVAGGLHMVGGQALIHVWTEVWTGTWIPRDATQATPCDAARIRFASSELKGTAPDAVLVVLADMLQKGKMSVEVNAYAIGGMAVDMDKPDKGVHEIKGNTYFHRLYGFAVQKPADFRFQERLPFAAEIGIMGKGGMKEKVIIRASASNLSQTLHSILDSTEANFVSSGVRETKVGGMPALIAKFDPKGGRGYAPLTCYVHAGDTVLTLECTDNTAAVRAAFELALKTLTFK